MRYGVHYPIVLKIEKKFMIGMSISDVNGKVIHVVQRAPPSSAYGNNDTPNASNSNTGPTPGRRFEHTGTMYLGAMAFPSGVGDLMDGGSVY